MQRILKRSEHCSLDACIPNKISYNQITFQLLIKYHFAQLGGLLHLLQFIAKQRRKDEHVGDARN